MSTLTLCVNTASLYRQQPQDGTQGGQAPSVFAPDQSAWYAPCSIQPSSASTQMRYMQLNMIVSHTLYFATDYQPFLGDKWVTGDGREFIVRGWYNSLELDDAWVCDCEEYRVPLPGLVP